ncbi:hypothetical protein H6F43_15955 [Leptolyngbya sp. FACHB-36]|nr:hypothetical protein [Leptolyngbya sp. FACHB-36]MBD2021674.1 hypothetical protein [Leptolyngbya sp. FACHB-36]
MEQTQQAQGRDEESGASSFGDTSIDWEGTIDRAFPASILIDPVSD